MLSFLRLTFRVSADSVPLVRIFAAPVFDTHETLVTVPSTYARFESRSVPLVSSLISRLLPWPWSGLPASILMVTLPQACTSVVARQAVEATFEGAVGVPGRPAAPGGWGPRAGWPWARVTSQLPRLWLR